MPNSNTQFMADLVEPVVPAQNGNKLSVFML